MSGFGDVKKDLKQFKNAVPPATAQQSAAPQEPTSQSVYMQPTVAQAHPYPVQSESVEVPDVPMEIVHSFTVVDIDASAMSNIAKEYSPMLNTIDCVADTSMLLNYMVARERKDNVTFSFPACGVDPVVFDVQAESLGDAGQPGVIPITVPGGAASENHEEFYEKIEVDGVLYLSCISQCLNDQYLHQVIAEATEEVYIHNHYMYTLVGPRPLLSTDTDGTCSFINTLKLNSYELSVLLAYMGRIPNIQIQHIVHNDHMAILFTR